MDYPLRVVLSRAIESDEVADAAARLCCQLGNLRKADPPGDPPATCAAHEVAQKAGPKYARAYSLLGTIRDCSADWQRQDWTAPALALKTKSCRRRRVPSAFATSSSTLCLKPLKSPPTGSAAACSTHRAVDGSAAPVRADQLQNAQMRVVGKLRLGFRSRQSNP